MLSFGRLQKLWKLAGPEPTLFLELRDCHSYAFSPDSRQVAFGRKDGFVDYYDLASGQQVRRLPVGAEPRALAFHPAGRQLAIAFAADVQVRDDAGQKLVEFPVAECSYLAWHPDGKVLAAVGEANIIYLWEVVTHKQTAKLEGCRNAGIHIAFNHAGNLLASTGWEGILRLWDPRTGKQLFHTPATMWSPHFSADDRFLAAEFIGTKLRIWEVDTGREYRTPARVPVHREIGTRSTVSPEGRLLAVGTINSGFGLWDLASGKELLFHPMPGITQVVFEPCGALLVQGWNRLWRWPVQIEGTTVRIGPPQPISLPGSVCRVACSGDGRVIASPQFWGALVLNTNHPERLVILSQPTAAAFLRFSKVAAAPTRIMSFRAERHAAAMSRGTRRPPLPPGPRWVKTQVGRNGQVTMYASFAPPSSPAAPAAWIKECGRPRRTGNGQVTRRPPLPSDRHWLTRRPSSRERPIRPGHGPIPGAKLGEAAPAARSAEA
jgi:hypothetical protein